VSDILLGIIELYEVVLAWPNPTHGNLKKYDPTQPNPWVNPTHVHVWVTGWAVGLLTAAARDGWVIGQPPTGNGDNDDDCNFFLLSPLTSANYVTSQQMTSLTSRRWRHRLAVPALKCLQTKSRWHSVNNYRNEIAVVASRYCKPTKNRMNAVIKRLKIATGGISVLLEISQRFKETT